MSTFPTEVAARALRVARATALGILGDPDAADEVAQEVAIVAVTQAHRLRSSGALDAWLHKITVRTALAAARRSQARRRAEVAHQQTRRHQQDGHADALELLAGLPARQRAALTLRYLHDPPDEAIATALGCRPGTCARCSRGGARPSAKPIPEKVLPDDRYRATGGVRDARPRPDRCGSRRRRGRRTSATEGPALGAFRRPRGRGRHRGRCSAGRPADRSGRGRRAGLGGVTAPAGRRGRGEAAGVHRLPLHGRDHAPP